MFTEYLTKFPHVYPIKSKSADEVASKLLDYISIYEPPKILISDQGKEFLNEVVSSLSKVAGVDRIITSSYHPQTNGLVERFNQTLTNTLRRLVNEDSSNWVKYIPFTLLAYRTKVNSITKLTPFELFYGRTMNNFENWCEKQESKRGDEPIPLFVRIKKFY